MILDNKKLRMEVVSREERKRVFWKKKKNDHFKYLTKDLGEVEREVVHIQNRLLWVVAISSLLLVLIVLSRVNSALFAGLFFLSISLCIGISGWLAFKHRILYYVVGVYSGVMEGNSARITGVIYILGSIVTFLLAAMFFYFEIASRVGI